MDQPELLDAAVVRTWAHTVVEALDTARSELDRVNVFPVADGDTGTNMYLTLREAAGAVHDAGADDSGAKLLRVAARSALLGARGNSGIILSEWLRGFAVAASRQDTLAVGLDVAARSARRAVARPVPGTILTAADAAAAAARHAEAGGMVGPLGAPRRLSVIDAARGGAREAALRSVGSLAPLRAAGVLDAGACGLVLVLASLAAAQRAAGEPGTSPVPGGTAPVLLDMDLRGYVPDGDDAVEVPEADAGPAPGGLDEVELMFVLHRSAGAEGFGAGAVADALRADLDRVGNSVVVVGGSADDVDSLWQAHVHAPDLDVALEVPRRWAERGEISHVHVRHLAVPPTDWAVVVTTSAPALAAELATGGAVVLLDLDTAPTVDDLAQAAVAAETPNVLVLAAPEALEGLEDAVGELVARDVAHGGAGTRPRLAAVPAPGDVHLVTAVSALAGALDAVRAGGDVLDVPGVVRSAHRRLRADRVPADGAAAAMARLVEDCEDGAGIVAVLPDAGVSTRVLEEVVARAGACAPEADVVVLATGRPGTRIGIGVEPAEDVVDEALLPAWDGDGR